MKQSTEPCTEHLIDWLIDNFSIRNDAALARKLRLTPPQISKLRHGKLTIGDNFLIRAHEEFDIPIAELKALAGLPKFECK